MKPSEQRLSEARRHHTEAVVARHVHELFKRLPMLSGFWLRPDLKVAELSVFTWPGYTPGQDLYEELMQSLIELAEERFEAVQLLHYPANAMVYAATHHPPGAGARRYARQVSPSALQTPSGKISCYPTIYRSVG